MSTPGNDVRGRGRGRGGGGGGGYRGGNRGGGTFRGSSDFTGRGGDRDGPAGFRGGRGDFRSRGDQRSSMPSRGGSRGRGTPGPVEMFIQPGGVLSPDTNVRSIEDSTLGSSGGISLQSLALGSKMPFRPGFGTQGTPIILYANYFQLVPPKSLPLHRYGIEFLPGVEGRRPESKRLLKWLVKLLLQQRLAEYGNDIVTDFSSTIISKTDLGIGQGNTYQVQYRAEDEDEPRPNCRIYAIRVQQTGTVESSELVDYLTSSNLSAIYEQKSDVIQALNIIVGHYNKASNSVLFAKPSKYYPFDGSAVEISELGGGLQAFRGYFVSVRAATARILVNIQVKHAACYKEGPLKALVREFQQTSGPNKYRLESFLKRLRIRPIHIPRKNRAGQEILRFKSIAALASVHDGRNLSHPPVVPSFGAGANDVEFYIGDGVSGGQEGPGSGDVAGAQKGKQARGKGSKRGKQLMSGPSRPLRAGSVVQGYISVAAHFRQKYNLLTDPDLPVINVGTRQNPSYLPIEVCHVVPGQPFNKNLSPAQTSNMIGMAVRRPNENAKSISMTGSRLVGAGSGPNPPLAAFGLSLTPAMITVPGRVLNGPDVEYRGGKIVRTKFGSWNMQNIEFSEGTTLPAWSYLWVRFQEAPDIAKDLAQLQPWIDRFTGILATNGINAAPPIPGTSISLTGGPGDDGIIDQIFTQILNHPAKPLLMLIILPNGDKKIYNRVKFMGDIKTGIQTVCVIGSKFAKLTYDNNAQYLANVALKVNLKLGGRNQSLKEARLGIIGEGKTMVVGLDVTHPSPGSSENAPSVAGIVASIDKDLAQWPADVRIQTPRQEMVSDLCNMFEARLGVWKKANKQALPENVLIYRDGVSEGQYGTVLDLELPEIRKACEKVYSAIETKNALPYITIVVVGKRHHTRFYPTDLREADDRSGNPKNGTIVDRGITEARSWDFYLQAHSSGLGTARPAHYYIILDEIFRRTFKLRKTREPFKHAADMIENLTHNLCYMFGRATKAVSICPPAYYADLVCERARCYLSNVFDGSTPAASVSEGTEGQGQGQDQPLQQMREDVRIHERLRDTMFYI